MAAVLASESHTAICFTCCLDSVNRVIMCVKRIGRLAEIRNSSVGQGDNEIAFSGYLDFGNANTVRTVFAISTVLSICAIRATSKNTGVSCADPPVAIGSNIGRKAVDTIFAGFALDTLLACRSRSASISLFTLRAGVTFITFVTFLCKRRERFLINLLAAVASGKCEKTGCQHKG